MIEYLLDANIVSELPRNQPNPRVRAFMASVGSSSLFLSVLTIGELRKGVTRKQVKDPVGARKYALFIDKLEATFVDRILDVDAEIAKVWGRLSENRSRPVVDTLLAATAIVHDLTLVTRNTADMSGLPVNLLNPWLF